MKIVLDKDTYSGVDGSSLSEERENQILKIYEFAEHLNCSLTYKSLQEKATSAAIFGTTKAAQCIRTIFPLLKKLKFVNYEETNSFNGADCFTSLGKQYVLIHRTYKNAVAANNESVKNKLISMKREIIREGLTRMFQDPEYNSHNMWIATTLLCKMDYINWDEFMYVVYLIKEGQQSYDDAIEAIKSLRADDDKLEIKRLDDNNNLIDLPSTAWTYIRSLLQEAGLITSGPFTKTSITTDQISRTFLKSISF